MKFLLLNRVTYPLCLIVMLGFMLISARPAQPFDSMIAFSSDREGRLDIFVMKSDGSRQHNLTQNPADDIGGSWVLGELAVSPKISLLTPWGEIKVLEGEEK